MRCDRGPAETSAPSRWRGDRGAAKHGGKGVPEACPHAWWRDGCAGSHIFETFSVRDQTGSPCYPCRGRQWLSRMQRETVAVTNSSWALLRCWSGDLVTAYLGSWVSILPRSGHHDCEQDCGKWSMLVGRFLWRDRTKVASNTGPMAMRQYVACFHCTLYRT